MWIMEGLIAGLVAGVIMGVFSQIGYWIKMVRSHLIVIDGTFARKMMKVGGGTSASYAFGTVIHLVTSAVFGIVGCLHPVKDISSLSRVVLV